MKQALEHFQKKDPKLYDFARKIGKLRVLAPDKPKNYFYRLTYDIVGQQLSDKASSTIFNRFRELLPGGIIEPQKVMALPPEAMRKAGMSNAKARYLKNLAEVVIAGKLKLDEYPFMTDEEVIDDLIQVKGIGRWTAEMFLIFTLGRPDVFSYGDLGLKNGIRKIYGIADYKDKTPIEKLLQNWTPYKSYACLVLWSSLELD